MAPEIRLETDLVERFGISYVESIRQRIQDRIANVRTDATNLPADRGGGSACVNYNEVDVRPGVGDELAPFGISSFIRPLRSIPLYYQAAVPSLSHPLSLHGALLPHRT